MDETLNDFVIGIGTTVNTMGNEGLDFQANGRLEDYGGFVESAIQNRVKGSNTIDRIRNAVDSAVIVDEIRKRDAILTVMNNVVIPRVEMAVRSSTGSSGNGPNHLI